MLDPGIAEHQNLFLVATFILIIAILAMTESIEQAMTYVGLIAYFLLISTNLNMIKHQSQHAAPYGPAHAGAAKHAIPGGAARPAIPGGAARPAEGFAMPGPHPALPADSPYRGELSRAELVSALQRSSTAPGMPVDEFLSPSDQYGDQGIPPVVSGGYHGHVPLAGPRAARPAGDSMYSTSYLCGAQPSHMAMSFDERSAFNGIKASARANPTRALSNKIHQKELYNRYFRDELDAEEDSYWWGRHET